MEDVFKYCYLGLKNIYGWYPDVASAGWAILRPFPQGGLGVWVEVSREPVGVRSVGGVRAFTTLTQANCPALGVPGTLATRHQRRGDGVKGLHRGEKHLVATSRRLKRSREQAGGNGGATHTRRGPGAQTGNTYGFAKGTVPHKLVFLRAFPGGGGVRVLSAC